MFQTTAKQQCSGHSSAPATSKTFRGAQEDKLCTPRNEHTLVGFVLGVGLSDKRRPWALFVHARVSLTVVLFSLLLFSYPLPSRIIRQEITLEGWIWNRRPGAACKYKGQMLVHSIHHSRPAFPLHIVERVDSGPQPFPSSSFHFLRALTATTYSSTLNVLTIRSKRSFLHSIHEQETSNST